MKDDTTEDEYKYINLYKIPHIVFFSFLVLSWILLIVTFSGTTYWYKYENSKQNITIQWRFTEVKFENSSNQTNIITEYLKYGKNESSVFRACIAFTILSFVCVNLILIGFLFQILQRYIYGKWLIVSMRFLPTLAWLFAFLSILICLAFNNAYEKDCSGSITTTSTNNTTTTMVCQKSIYNGGFKNSNNKGESWGPDVGFWTSLIAMLVLFVSAVISLVINKDFIPRFINEPEKLIDQDQHQQKQQHNKENGNMKESISTTTISANNNLQILP